jgi:hypothetical protein
VSFGGNSDNIRFKSFIMPSTSFPSNSRIRRRNPLLRGKKPVKKLWSIASQAQPCADTPRPQDNVIHRFVQQQDLGTILTTSASVATALGINFQLTNVPNSSSYTSLFDQYRIAEIEFWVQPQAQNNGGGAGILYSAVDYDSASSSLTPSQVSQYSNVLMAPMTIQGHYHRFVPHVAVAAYSGSFSSYQNQAAPWIDCSSSTVQHYGIVIAAGIAGGAVPLDGQVRYHLEFRNVV